MVDLRTLTRLVLVLASSLILIWSAQRSLAGASFGAPEARTYVVAARLPARGGDSPAPAEVVLRHAVIDGKKVAWRYVRRTGSWTQEEESLVHRDDGQPARLEIRGRRVELAFAPSTESGVIDIQADSKPIGAVDLSEPPDDSTLPALVALSGGHLEVARTGRFELSAPMVLWTSVVLLLLLSSLRPWRSPTRLTTWAVIYVVIMHTLVWLTQGVNTNSDSQGYLEGINPFLDGQPSYFPPGYSLFLAPFLWMSPSTGGLVITAAQHLLMVVGLVLAQRLVEPVLGTTGAAAGLLIAGSAAPTLFFPQTILSETFAFVTMSAALWLTTRPAADRGVALDLVAGLCLGWSTLSRAVPFAAVAGPIVLLHLANYGLTRHAASRIARVLATSAATVAGAMLWIWAGSGMFGLADSSDLHLYNRVVTEQALVDPSAPATQQFVGVLGHAPLGDVSHWDVKAALEGQGLSYQQSVELMGAVAREGLRGHALEFARHTPALAWREYLAGGQAQAPLWSDEAESAAIVEDDAPLGVGRSVAWRVELERAFGTAWPVLMCAPLLGVLGAIWLPQPAYYVAPLLLATGYLMASAVVEFFNERFVAGVIPFVLVLVPGPFVAAASAVAWIASKLQRSKLVSTRRP